MPIIIGFFFDMKENPIHIWNRFQPEWASTARCGKFWQAQISNEFNQKHTLFSNCRNMQLGYHSTNIQNPRHRTSQPTHQITGAYLPYEARRFFDGCWLIGYSLMFQMRVGIIPFGLLGWCDDPPWPTPSKAGQQLLERSIFGSSTIMGGSKNLP